MTGRFFAVSLLAALAGFPAMGREAAQVSQPADVGRSLLLADFVSTATRDTNGDDIPDAVVARVVVPAAPAPEDVAAAANIAARLGFETMALTLPFVVRDSELSRAPDIALPILVGRENQFIRKAIDDGRLDVAQLQPGQGLIAIVDAPLGGGDGIVVVGGDDEGTLAAGVQLGARLPRLWGASGITLAAIEEQTIHYLRSRGVTASAATVHGIVVDSDRRGIASVNVRLAAQPRDATRALRLLEELDQAHRRGLEPRTLNFGNAAAVAIEVVSDGRPAGRAVVRRSGLNSRTLTPPIDPAELAPDSPGARGRPPEGPGATGSNAFDLTSAYSTEGWFGDAYRDLIPDRVDAAVVVGDGPDALGAAHIAARLGLESTGITLPLARLDRAIGDPSREASPILVGRSNRLVRALEKIGKARFDDLQPGDGAIQIVPKAFGAATATVVAGADLAGTEHAALHLATRVPYLWTVARGAASLEDLSTELWRFLEARSGAGQASVAVGELDAALESLRGKSIESFEAKLFLEASDKALEAHLTDQIRTALPEAAVTVTTQGVTDPVPVFEDRLDVPWEVDAFRTRFREAVLPSVKSGTQVDIDVGLSESPQVRQTLAAEIREALAKAGATRARVRVLSAYKAGFMWLTEEVIPELKGKSVASVRIAAATHKPDLTKRYKFFTEPSRWLHELHPIDEVIERELRIPRDAVTLELVDSSRETYSVEAIDSAGRVIMRAEFSPRVVEREYLEPFPGWSRVEVSTGWLKALIDGKTVADERVETDPEAFWTHYQTKILPRIRDYVLKNTNGQPLPSKQPFHRDFDVEVWMSEPDFPIGIDQEHVSSLESLHEDLYFVTLDFFDALGRTSVRQRLAAPGKILPIIHPERTGRAGHVRALYARNAAAGPSLELTWREKGVPDPGRLTRPLERADVSSPAAVRIVARADRVREVELRVEANGDRQATRAVDALEALARLQAAGLYRTSLSYERVDRVVVAVASGVTASRRVIPYTGTAAPTNVRAAGQPPTTPLVSWSHVIGPDEAEELVGKLAAYPAIRAYRAGRSYRGRPISVVEVTSPVGGELMSRAKATTWKPTIQVTARQHANEVSSTNASLRLAELLATDRAYASILRKVNVILQPVENPDGAAIAYELQKLTPAHMLHAGRYTALGMDVGSQVNVDDPLLPESLVRGRLWRDWLPDIYLNAHGYPAHEWVQRFAGYVPPAFKGDWTPRGFHIRVSGLRDPRYPGHEHLLEAMREGIVREINAHPDVKAMNLRYQARYRRWAFGFAPSLYNQEIYRDTALYYTDAESGAPLGSRRAATSFGRGGTGGRMPMALWPQVTTFSSTSEVPDETVRGRSLEIVAQAAFANMMANIKYLRDGQYEVERIEEDGSQESMTRTVLRVRPVQPPRRGQTVVTDGQ
jgi:hypothetical protein